MWGGDNVLYGKGNHVVNCIIYLAFGAIFMTVLIKAPTQNQDTWRFIVLGILCSSICAVGCAGELVLQKMKMKQNNDKAVEATRVKYMYSTYALGVIFALTALFLFRR